MNTNLVQIQDEKNEAQGLDQNHTQIQAWDLKKFWRNLNTKNNWIISYFFMIMLRFRFWPFQIPYKLKVLTYRHKIWVRAFQANQAWRARQISQVKQALFT